MKKQLNEIKRMQQLAGIITESQLNEDKKSTHISKVDWYYIDHSSDYPGPKGRVVPDAEGFDSPGEYNGTELYIRKGTKGYVDGNRFEDEEGNDVPFEKEYFTEETFDTKSQMDESEYQESLVNEDEDFDMEDDDDFDLNAAFKASPMSHSYNDVLDVIEDYEDESILSDFKDEFPEGEDISRKDYSDFAMSMIDDMSEVGYIQANWISISDPDIYDKAGLNESSLNEEIYSVSDETYGEMDNLIYTDYKDDYDNFISSATNIMDTLMKNNFKVEDIFDYLKSRLEAEV